MRPLLIFMLLSVLTGCDMIQDQLDGNQPPVIEAFDVDSAEGSAPLLVGFTWTVADIEGDALTCSLDFGDGSKEEVGNCSQIVNAFHTYNAPGGLVAIMAVSDEQTTVMKSLALRIEDSANDSDSAVLKQHTRRLILSR